LPKKARSTQSLVNTYPGWADIRTDEQSLGFQLLNVVAGDKLEDLNRQLDNVGNNYFLPTSVISDPDVFYSFELPRNYEFTASDQDTAQASFIVPTVSGLVGEEEFSVVLASGNNLENWWYRSVPDRIEAGTSVSGAHLLASGFAIQSPLLPLTTSGIPHISNSLYVTVSGGSSYLGISDSTNQARRGTVLVEGVTRAGLEITEELVFLYDGTQKTLHDYRELTEARVFGIEEDEEAHIRVTSARFRDGPYEDIYELDQTPERIDITTLWGFSAGESVEQYTLDFLKYDADDIELRMDGFNTKSSIIKQELLSVSGTNIRPLDIALEPVFNRAWIVDDHNNLLCYETNLPYPNTKPLTGRNYDSPTRIEPSSYYILRGQQVELNYVWRRPVQGLVKHRVWVTQPDGTKQSVVAGAFTAYTTGDSSWLFGEPTGRSLRPTDTLTLDQHGDYVFALETVYADNTSSIDKRIISVVAIRPRCQFDLSTIGVDNVHGVDIDSEGKLWILNTSDGKTEIISHHDQMLIDFDKKVIYFRENYNSIRVY
jgi:hypothetical protein